jgi:hypothetical protein
MSSASLAPHFGQTQSGNAVILAYRSIVLMLGIFIVILHNVPYPETVPTECPMHRQIGTGDFYVIAATIRTIGFNL